MKNAYYRIGFVGIWLGAIAAVLIVAVAAVLNVLAIIAEVLQ
jgi:hypothetical protein